ncbi:MAG TPA: STAS domain-containing protein [Spirochaetota bacterium]|nr:STAS domain-containing protein [Spirochaetota bacterium]HPS87344.1 STAS domain-containing protein [Spirochaetota bacterium]
MKVDKDVSVKNINNFYFALREEVENNNQVVIDFSDLSRIDSAAAQVILAAARKVKELDKTIRFVGVSSELKKLLKLAGIKLQ